MELANAQRSVKILTRQFEELNAFRTEKIKEIKELKKRGGSRVEVGEANTYHRYMELINEVEALKQELCKLKLDISSVLETKMQAEKQYQDSLSRSMSNERTMEALKKAIEEVNEKELHLLLARMKALRELKAIEDQRKAHAAHFSTAMGKTRIDIDNLVREIKDPKSIKMKLEVTSSDADVLQKELKPVESMGSKVSTHQWSSSGLASSKRNKEDEMASASLQSVTEELNEAKRELELIKEEGFNLMASMDLIRNELQHISKETALSENEEKKTESIAKNLNFKLLRAKSRLESVTAAEAKDRSIISNLAASLRKLQIETEAAKREKEQIYKETASIRSEIQKTQCNIKLEKERLHDVMLELEASKSSEALALENLRNYAEKAMVTRASLSRHSSSITISEFEYEYLTRRAERAEEIADKKVAAAQAWIEALRFGEEEMKTKTEAVLQQMRELSVAKDQELCKYEKALAAREATIQLCNSQQREKITDGEELHLEVPMPRKTMREINSPMTPRRAMKYRPISPGIRYLGCSNSIDVRKKRKMMLSIIKFFKGAKNMR